MAPARAGRALDLDKLVTSSESFDRAELGRLALGRRSSPSPSHPTAAPWRRAATTAPSCSGTSRPGAPARASKQTTSPSTRGSGAVAGLRARRKAARLGRDGWNAAPLGSAIVAGGREHAAIGRPGQIRLLLCDRHREIGSAARSADCGAIYFHDQRSRGEPLSVGHQGKGQGIRTAVGVRGSNGQGSRAAVLVCCHVERLRRNLLGGRAVSTGAGVVRRIQAGRSAIGAAPSATDGTADRAGQHNH